jgi:hypothetical protein
MAAPHVSGAAALMESATPDDLSPSEIRTALESTARKPNGWNEPDDQRDDRYGYGIIDAYNATSNVTGTTVPYNFTVVSVNPTDLRVANGYRLSVTAEIQNTGDAGESVVQLKINGTPEENRSVNIGATNTTTVKLTHNISLPPGSYEYTVSTQNDTESANLTIVNSAFDKPIISGVDSFRGPPTNTSEIHPSLYEDLSGDGDGKEVAQTVRVFARTIRGDLNLTETEASKLNWDGKDPGDVTPSDMVALFGRQIRSK